MDLSMKVFVVVLLIFVTTEDGALVQVALANKQCGGRRSHTYHGSCSSEPNTPCNKACVSEGFTAGHCVKQIDRHHCFCYNC
ncbi:hypothetical protein BRADI_1g56913v3 [Brachypodium distachyon]|uniref:Knottins-like domain-containing protein n=1 Tax=Brachypodium distachyon TaxID=15368 RepID=A0A2K2DRX0_BRADI|nr:hypothetical protein BRADI_1g56913v3 [Brachypodium distachyon]